MLEILLATYNSGEYLAEQLDSLFAQTVQDWHLTVQDDGSSDNTCALVEQYAAQYPGRITLRRNEKNLGGAKYNFYDMLLKSIGDYIMTCDHDDIWKPDKIERTMASMKDLETFYGKDRPLLVHTDLTVADGDGNPIAESMFFRQNLDPSRRSLGELLVQNNVTGCTMLVNRVLVDLLPETPPPNLIMHDWWMALVAAAFGGIGFVKEPTILYRQHGDNEVGAKDARSLGYNARRAAKFGAARQAVADTYLQAADFAQAYRGLLSPSQQELVDAYGDMGNRSKLGRLRTLRRYRLWKNGLARRVGQFLFC